MTSPFEILYWSTMHGVFVGTTTDLHVHISTNAVSWSKIDQYSLFGVWVSWDGRIITLRNDELLEYLPDEDIWSKIWEPGPDILLAHSVPRFESHFDYLFAWNNTNRKIAVRRLSDGAGLLETLPLPLHLAPLEKDGCLRLLACTTTWYPSGAPVWESACIGDSPQKSPLAYPNVPDHAQPDADDLTPPGPVTLTLSPVVWLVGAVGERYSIQWSNLTSGPWQEAAVVQVASTEPTPWVDPAAYLKQPRKFYRAVKVGSP